MTDRWTPSHIAQLHTRLEALPSDFLGWRRAEYELKRDWLELSGFREGVALRLDAKPGRVPDSRQVLGLRMLARRVWDGEAYDEIANVNDLTIDGMDPIISEYMEVIEHDALQVLWEDIGTHDALYIRSEFDAGCVIHRKHYPYVGVDLSAQIIARVLGHHHLDHPSALFTDRVSSDCPQDADCRTWAEAFLVSASQPARGTNHAES